MISGVASLEKSSRTKSSKFGYDCEHIDDNTRSIFFSSFLAGTQMEMSGSSAGRFVSDTMGVNPILFLNRITDVKRRNKRENDVSQKRVKGSIK
jgi:hypothetical protein